MLPRQRRLTSRRDFKAAFTGGRSFSNRLAILKVLPTSGQPSRFAFSTSAKLGTTVARNRAKRLLREAVRSILGQLSVTGYDAVLISRPPARDAGLPEVTSAAADLLRRSGLFKAKSERTVQDQ